MQKNRIELAGFLAAKPEIRYLPSGTPVANARLAEGYEFTDRNNEVQKHTNWHSLVFYGDLADVAVTYDKGENILVEGTLQTRKFRPSDGSPRTVYEVVARTVYQIAKPRTSTAPAEDNNPGVQQSRVNESTEEMEAVANDQIWPS